ncbi:MAG: hypothetical protein JSU81_09050 [Candidatus Coatesbacteria bacterium]|nr:MAG: hypothetical protein JSU81_09050 [Candidatus Coatesbacteria bacterium]
MRMRTATPLLFAAAAALGCAGAGTPEETLETFHGHMASRDFRGAAAVVYCTEWEGLPAAEVAAARRAYASVLAAEFDAGGLDYGRAEITDRARAGPNEVRLAVAYRLRARPSGPPQIEEVTVRKIEARWYVVAETAASSDPLEG